MNSGLMDFVVWYGQLILASGTLFFVFFAPIFLLVKLFFIMLDSDE